MQCKVSVDTPEFSSLLGLQGPWRKPLSGDNSADCRSYPSRCGPSDNALLTQSRFLFLEPFLILFGVLGVLCLARFRHCRERPFSAAWFGWLVLGFVFLGAAVT